jgi:hypothetical protein
LGWLLKQESLSRYALIKIHAATACDRLMCSLLLRFTECREILNGKFDGALKKFGNGMAGADISKLKIRILHEFNGQCCSKYLVITQCDSCCCHCYRSERRRA